MTVYFISNGRGQVKIGHTDDPAARLAQLQVASVQPLTIVRLADGGAAAERWLHRRFSLQRVRGEWFDFTADMLSVQVPDETPAHAAPVERYRSTAAFLRAADGLGILTDELRHSLGVA